VWLVAPPRSGCVPAANAGGLRRWLAPGLTPSATPVLPKFLTNPKTKFFLTKLPKNRIFLLLFKIFLTFLFLPKLSRDFLLFKKVNLTFLFYLKLPLTFLL
jgi:hypothetical protein